MNPFGRPVLAFDIETIPDTEGLRRRYALGDELADGEVADLAFQKQRQKKGHDFLPLVWHRVVAISCCLRDEMGLRLWSLDGAGEAELIAAFFELAGKTRPLLVSWNGEGFDLPVLRYRAMAHRLAVASPGDHTDLMRALAGRGDFMSLQDVAIALGLPGKPGMAGADVWPAWQRGEQERIRQYCAADTANTWLIFLRQALLEGRIAPDLHAEEEKALHALLSENPLVREWTAQP